MNYLEIGKKIKYLRKGKGVTQEALANHLGVTTQAVSKWENEATAPDISLLPDISVYFGVTIDELFSLTDDAKMERIDNMLDNERYISNTEFNEAENFLKEIISNYNNSEENRVKAITTLTWLYLHRVQEYQGKAAFYAKEGIKLAPFNSELHKGLNNAHKVPIGDWNVMNHAEKIAYYNEFLKKYPEHRTGYMWLLDALINDGRLKEARAVLSKYEEMMKRKSDEDWRIMHYKALIELKEGYKDKANEIWDEMLKKYSDIMGPYFERAVVHSYNGEWKDAILCFEKDFELMGKPRYSDSLDAIAQIYEITGDYQKAIETYERYIQLLQNEWDVVEGELVDYPKREIERLTRRIRTQGQKR